MIQVFISYSHKDSQYARTLANHLKRHGVNVWIDDRIEYGSKWTSEIEKGLNDSQAVIVIMSSNSKESEWVQNELVYAQGKKKIIYPFLLEGEGTWLSLAITQHVDVRGGKMPSENFYEILRNTVNDENPWSKSSSEAWESLNEPNASNAEEMEKIRKAWNMKGWNNED
jgi:hypothetical protein